MDTTSTIETDIRVRLDREDTELLRACTAIEKLSRPDVVRRALREYAKKLLAENPRSQSKVA